MILFCSLKDASQSLIGHLSGAELVRHKENVADLGICDLYLALQVAFYPLKSLSIRLCEGYCGVASGSLGSAFNPIKGKMIHRFCRVHKYFCE